MDIQLQQVVIKHDNGNKTVFSRMNGSKARLNGHVSSDLMAHVTNMANAGELSAGSEFQHSGFSYTVLSDTVVSI